MSKDLDRKEDIEEDMKGYWEQHMEKDREEEIRYGSNYRLSVQKRYADSDRYEIDKEAIGLESKQDINRFGEGGTK